MFDECIYVLNADRPCLKMLIVRREIEKKPTGRKSEAINTGRHINL